MSTVNFATASLLAADLRGAGVDHNEVKKLLSYMRSQTTGRALFDYLKQILTNEAIVRRSNQTPEHFKAILQASERHLRPLQGDYRQLITTLGWSIRLLRYYKEVPDAVPAYTSTTSAKAPIGGIVAPPETVTAVPQTPRPTGQAMLEPGTIFTGKILELDAGTVVIEVPGFTHDKALGIIKAENLGGKKFKMGNAARVEVLSSRTLNRGRVILDVRPAPKPES